MHGQKDHIISRLAARALLRDLLDDPDNPHEELIRELSCRFHLLSPWTQFLAIEK